MKFTFKTEDNVIPANRLKPGQKGVVTDYGLNAPHADLGDVVYGTAEKTDRPGYTKVFNLRTGRIFTAGFCSGDSTTFVRIDDPPLTVADLKPGDMFVQGDDVFVCVQNKYYALTVDHLYAVRLLDGFFADFTDDGGPVHRVASLEGTSA